MADTIEDLKNEIQRGKKLLGQLSVCSCHKKPVTDAMIEELAVFNVSFLGGDTLEQAVKELQAEIANLELKKDYQSGFEYEAAASGKRKGRDYQQVAFNPKRERTTSPLTLKSLRQVLLQSDCLFNNRMNETHTITDDSWKRYYHEDFLPLSNRSGTLQEVVTLWSQDNRAETYPAIPAHPGIGKTRILITLTQPLRSKLGSSRKYWSDPAKYPNNDVFNSNEKAKLDALNTVQDSKKREDLLKAVCVAITFNAESRVIEFERDTDQKIGMRLLWSYFTRGLTFRSFLQMMQKQEWFDVVEPAMAMKLILEDCRELSQDPEIKVIVAVDELLKATPTAEQDAGSAITVATGMLSALKVLLDDANVFVVVSSISYHAVVSSKSGKAIKYVKLPSILDRDPILSAFSRKCEWPVDDMSLKSHARALWTACGGHGRLLQQSLIWLNNQRLSRRHQQDSFVNVLESELASVSSVLATMADSFNFEDFLNSFAEATLYCLDPRKVLDLAVRKKLYDAGCLPFFLDIATLKLERNMPLFYFIVANTKSEIWDQFRADFSEIIQLCANITWGIVRCAVSGTHFELIAQYIVELLLAMMRQAGKSQFSLEKLFGCRDASQGTGFHHVTTIPNIAHLKVPACVQMVLVQDAEDLAAKIPTIAPGEFVVFPPSNAVPGIDGVLCLEAKHGKKLLLLFQWKFSSEYSTTQFGNGDVADSIFKTVKHHTWALPLLAAKNDADVMAVFVFFAYRQCTTNVDLGEIYQILEDKALEKKSKKKISSRIKGRICVLNNRSFLQLMPFIFNKFPA